VVLGGSLQQHIEDWSHASIKDPDAAPGVERVSARHEVSVSGNLAQLLGTDRLEVNSRHHQAVTPERLAPGLEITAMSDDGYVEGMADPARRWLVSVQWHPERIDAFIPGFHEQSMKLFTAFAGAVEAYATAPDPAALR
jgi:putative glutamine amidotransferase